MRIRKTILPILIMLGMACEEPFNVNIPAESINQLVVEGQITNEPGPYKVTFSTAFSLDSTQGDLLSVQSAFIEQQNGPAYSLSRNSEGSYETNAFQGEIGKSYKLVFRYAGVDYESDWVTLEPPTPIDSVYWQIEEKETEDPEVNIEGIQFYVNSTGTEENPNYFRWELNETWIVVTQQRADEYYLGNNQTIPRDPVPNICWQSDKQKGILIETTLNLDQNVISQQPLSFIQAEDRRFMERYSVEVVQYSIDEQEFLFWKNIKESIDESGGLFNTQPGQIRGNIRSIGQSSTVLGYFRGSSASRKRVFIDKMELPPQFTTDPLECNAIRISIFDFPTQAAVDNAVFDAIANGLIFIEIATTGPPRTIVGYDLGLPYCADCIVTGGTTDKPEYWID